MKTIDADIEVRPSAERGRFSNDWLEARFSFAFGNWRPAGREGFGRLRALNEDRVQPGTGFEMHGHRDLDIYLLPLAGMVEHRDDRGHHAWVRPGQVQRMVAGRGIRHSQFNPSSREPDHHLQIWLAPSRAGGTPTVESRDFHLFDPSGHWCHVVSPDGRGGSFVADAGTFMATTAVRGARPATWPLHERAMAYLHVIDGCVTARVGDAGVWHRLDVGDGLAIRRSAGQPLQIASPGAGGPARLLVFEFDAAEAARAPRS